MADEPMDIDGLGPAAQCGLKGVAGGLLERLEREAMAEQAELERRSESASAAAAAASSSALPAASPPATAIGGTYVPGANKKRRLSLKDTAEISTTHICSSAPNVTSSASKLPSSTSSAVNGVGTSPSGPAPSSTSNPPAAPPQIPELPIKKTRRQPTVRLTVTFPPYPPNKEPLARHVPIFNIHNLAESRGLLLPPEDVPVDDASSSGGSDDENDNDDKADESNAGEETAVEKDVSFATYTFSFSFLLTDLSRYPR